MCALSPESAYFLLFSVDKANKKKKRKKKKKKKDRLARSWHKMAEILIRFFIFEKYFYFDQNPESHSFQQY